MLLQFKSCQKYIFLASHPQPNLTLRVNKAQANINQMQLDKNVFPLGLFLILVFIILHLYYFLNISVYLLSDGRSRDLRLISHDGGDRRVGSPAEPYTHAPIVYLQFKVNRSHTYIIL